MPGLEDVDMDAYKYDPYDQRAQVDSVRANQRLLDNLARILSESEEKKEEEDMTLTC